MIGQGKTELLLFFEIKAVGDLELKKVGAIRPGFPPPELFSTYHRPEASEELLFPPQASLK